MIERRRRTELLKKSLAIAIIGSVWMQLVGGKSHDSAPAQQTHRPGPPAPGIKPLPVRPVQRSTLPMSAHGPQGPPPVLVPSSVDHRL